MQKLQFSVQIKASKDKVWSALFDDKNFRDWAGIIDEGTYMTGDLKEGGEIQFISAVNGYGVTSFVEKLVVGEFLLLKHSADTQNVGERERAKEWTGGEESYSLKEVGGVTILTAAFDVPPHMLEYFQTTYPKALERVKASQNALKCKSCTVKSSKSCLDANYGFCMVETNKVKPSTTLILAMDHQRVLSNWSGCQYNWNFGIYSGNQIVC